MSNYKVGDIVVIKSVEWYNDEIAKHPEGIYDPQKLYVFTKPMSVLCGEVCTIERITNTEIKLKWGKTRLIYLFHESWLEPYNKQEFDKQDQVNNKKVATLQISLEDAIKYWNSDNSMLQEIAMKCFSIKDLINNIA